MRTRRVRVQCSICLASVFIVGMDDAYNAQAQCADCQRKNDPEMTEEEYQEIKNMQARRKR